MLELRAFLRAVCIGNSVYQSEDEKALRELLDQRILVLDGAMGTMIQSHHLDEAAFRGERFSDHSHDLT